MLEEVEVGLLDAVHLLVLAHGDHRVGVSHHGTREYLNSLSVSSPVKTRSLNVDVFLALLLLQAVLEEVA